MFLFSMYNILIRTQIDILSFHVHGHLSNLNRCDSQEGPAIALSILWIPFVTSLLETTLVTA